MLLALLKAVRIRQVTASRHAQQREHAPTDKTNSLQFSQHTCFSSAWAMQANDFGSEVIPGAKDLGMHVQAYLYDGYWEDIGTIEAFYNANLALTKNPKPDYR